MNISNYKKGYSALRHIINDDELQYARHFGKFVFTMNDRWSERAQLKGIYNAKTNNVIAFVNGKGNVFIRPNSIYADHLLNSKNKVLIHNHLRDFRNKVPSNVKASAMWNNMAESAIDRLVNNGDEPNKVFLFAFNANNRLDERFIMQTIARTLKKNYKDGFKNTIYSLENSSLIAEQVIDQDKYKVYIEVGDYAEAIAEKERIERIKKEISEAFYNNISEIAQDSITSGHSLNPMQFTYTDSEGVEVTGRIKLQRLDLNYPREMPITDWLRPEDIANQIVFQERVGTLESRGIDEMAIRAEREEAERMQAQMYEHMANSMRPGAIINMPVEYMRRYQSNEVVWHNGVDTSAFWGAEEPDLVQVHPRDVVVEPPMPRMSIFEDEYPTAPDEIAELEAMMEEINTPETESPMSSA